MDLKIAQPNSDFEMAPDAQIVGIQYVAELESVCIVTDLGDIILFNLTNTTVRTLTIFVTQCKAQLFLTKVVFVLFYVLKLV